MTEDEFIDMVNKFYSNRLTKAEIYKVLYSYCISKGKPALATELFVKTAISFGIDIELIQYIIDYYTKKYQLIILRDREGNFIKIFKNEEINCTPICHSEESGTECQSASD